MVVREKSLQRLVGLSLVRLSSAWPQGAGKVVARHMLV